MEIRKSVETNDTRKPLFQFHVSLFSKNKNINPIPVAAMSMFAARFSLLLQTSEQNRVNKHLPFKLKSKYDTKLLIQCWHLRFCSDLSIVYGNRLTVGLKIFPID